MIEVIFDPDDMTIHACSSIQLDYSTDEDGKPSVSHDDGGEGVSLEEEKSRMVLLLGSLNKMTSLAEEYMQCSFLFYHFCNFLPSSVTEIFSYYVDVNILVQHSITNSFRTLLYFIFLDHSLLWISATTSIFTNHISITKQTVQTISI